MYNDSDKIKLTNYLSEIVAILQAFMQSKKIT